jgi:hypothetical protein
MKTLNNEQIEVCKSDHDFVVAPADQTSLEGCSVKVGPPDCACQAYRGAGSSRRNRATETQEPELHFAPTLCQIKPD